MVRVLAYVADAVVMTSYLTLAVRGLRKQFHVANTLCAPFIVGGEILVGAWPALVLSSFFGCVGAYGWFMGVAMERH